MFQRKTTGSVVCPSCGSLVGVRDDKCYGCGRSNPGLWGFAPVLRQLGFDLGFVPLVLGASSTLYVLTLLMSGPELVPFGGGMNVLVPALRALYLFGMSGAVPVFAEGRWWTLLSASWLHGNFLHILFNMMWVRQLGPEAAEAIGPSRTVIVYVLSGAVGFLLSSVLGQLGVPIPFFRGAAYTMGASASIFGLLGALVHYGHKSGRRMIHAEAMRYAVILFVMGLIMPNVDNSAHAGGFVGGYAVSAMMNPQSRERGDHLFLALGCLAATFLAVLLSVITAFSVM